LSTRLPAETRPARRRLLPAALALGLLARGLLLAGPLRSGALDDPDGYLPLARSLAAGAGFAIDGRPTAYRPPLYPMVLAPLAWSLGGRVAWGVAGLHLALGAGTIALTALAGRRWGLTRAGAGLAALVVALDPVLVSQGRSVMTETLAAFLAAWSLAALGRPGLRGAAAGGLILGLAGLCRPSALAVAGLTALAAALAPPGDRRHRLTRAIVLAAAAALPLCPWAARNALALGRPVWSTTHGGYTLYLANNRVYYDEVVRGPPGAVWSGRNQWLWWDAVNRANRGLREPEADRRNRDAALAVIAARPVDFLRATAARLGRFWGLRPAAGVYPDGLRLASALWTAPLWVLLASGLCRGPTRRWPRAAAAAGLVGLTAVHAVYWTDLRMRAPAVPAVALLAASGLRRFNINSDETAGPRTAAR